MGAALGCSGKLGNLSSPRPAHPGAIIPRSSRREDRPVLDAWLTGGAAQAHAQQLSLCKEPIAGDVVFLARYLVLLPAPGSRHTSQRPSDLSDLSDLSDSKRQPTNRAVCKTKNPVLLPAPGTQHTISPLSKYLKTSHPLPQPPTQSANQQTTLFAKKFKKFWDVVLTFAKCGCNLTSGWLHAQLKTGKSYADNN